MPDSMFTLFPSVQNYSETAKLPLAIGQNWLIVQRSVLQLARDITENNQASLSRGIHSLTKSIQPWDVSGRLPAYDSLLEAQTASWSVLTRQAEEQLAEIQKRLDNKSRFYDLFTPTLEDQEWDFMNEKAEVLCDLPGFRVYDISTEGPHRIQNYTVVFAPRAGHHSNIAERVALQLRTYGLTRMAIVEQKCAQDIPLTVDGRRHRENFDGQYRQYRQILQLLKEKSGKASHLVAVCQPGPLLISTLILNPDLGKTFGSAGAPMDTAGENGFLTDYARLMGENYVDWLVALSNPVKSGPESHHYRPVLDGRLHVLGFYLLGLKQHLRNFSQLHRDIALGNHEGADRQLTFYQWYNLVHHLPAGFIRDTYKKIFVNNELIEGNLTIDQTAIGIQDYPSTVPIWALGGRQDDIAPPMQATGHLAHLDHVPPADRLSLLCDGGHMALFRSSKVLAREYAEIARFIRQRSDTVEAA